MKLYYAGRALQLIGLLSMPSAVWAAEFLHSEPASVGIFVGAILVFGLGWILTAIGKRG